MRLVLISDAHVPKRAPDLPAPVWTAVERADLVVHAGVYGNNDGPPLRAPDSPRWPGSPPAASGSRSCTRPAARPPGSAAAPPRTRTSTCSSSEGHVLLPLAVSVVLVATFWRNQRRAANPLVPPALLRDRDRLGIYLAVATCVVGSFGLALLLTYHFQQVAG